MTTEQLTSQVTDPYIGTKFVNEGQTFVVWKLSTYKGETEYDAVALIDPSKPIGTEKYGTTSRGREVIDLHRLTNVDPDTHVSFSQKELERILNYPDLLYLAPAKKKAKKIIKTSRLG